MSGPSCYLEAESCADVTVILVEFIKTLGLFHQMCTESYSASVHSNHLNVVKITQLIISASSC